MTMNWPLRNRWLALVIVCAWIMAAACARGQTAPASGELNLTGSNTTPAASSQAPAKAVESSGPAASAASANNPSASSALAPPVATPPPQTPPPTATTPTLTLTPESINARLEQIQRTTEIEAAIKDAVVPLYQRALVDLKSAADAQRLRNELAGRMAGAPKALADAKQKKKQPALRPDDASMLDFLSFEELQQELQAEQVKLTAATDLRTKLSEQVDTREKRRKELPQLISEAKAKVEQVDREQAAPAATPITDPLLKEATTWAQTAQKMAAAEQVPVLEQEQRLYEAETELLPLQLELARADEKSRQEQVRRLNEQIDRVRQDSIAQQRQEVRRLVEDISEGPDAPASLYALGRQLQGRISQWLDLAKKKTAIKSDLNASKVLLEKWKDRYTKMVNRVEPQPGQDVVAGFNSWVGLMLRKQRSELPDPQKLERQIRDYQQQAQVMDAMLFELEDALQQIHSWREDGLSTIQSGTESNKSDMVSRSDLAIDVRPAYDRLLTKEQELIEAMKLDIDTYLNDLYQVADIKTQTNALVGSYRSFIEKHVLWIRSSEKLDQSDWAHTTEAFHWLVSIHNWQQLGQKLSQDLVSQPWWPILFTMALATVLLNHTRMRRVLSECGDRAAKRSVTSFSLTAQACLLTVVVTLPVPMLLLFFRWRLALLGEAGDTFAAAISHGLTVAAVVFIPFEFLRQVCRPGGLGIKHFEWSATAARMLAANLRWLIDLATPTATLVGVMEGQSNTRWQSSLGRLAFLVLMVLILCFSARVFFPRHGVFAQYLQQYRGGWLDRLRWVWYPLIVFSPIALAALSFIGFHYTAERLAMHLHSSFCSLVGLILIYSILRRWLLLSRRKIMVVQARQRLAEAAKRDPAQSVASPSEESEINLSIVNEQTMRLVTSFMIVSGLVAVGVIWSDVLPAIGMLERFKLWDVQGSKPNEVVTITLANLVIVIPIAILTVIAGRNLPGLMEIALLQHLPLTGAARYAISTLSRYTILILGVVTSCSAIGLRWSSIQWLVAALGVGLGFGLQEIFANFVSGIILLFEQPIRVGDVITLDGVTGNVSKIRMRATTLVNFDRQELIIPNKDLITGKLLNWTLSDTTNRIQIRVGLAYGTDTQRACEILESICQAHPNIMKDPALTVSFENFGESSLDVTIRAFLANLEVRLQTIHELHTSIYRELTAAGMEIAFPQRDLHIRSLPNYLLQSLTRPAAGSPTSETA